MQESPAVIGTLACDTLAETGWIQDTDNQMSLSKRRRQLELRLNARVRPSQKQGSQSECPTAGLAACGREGLEAECH